MITTLKVNEVYKECTLKQCFKDTSELEELQGVLIGQERAKKALEYGLLIDKYGYNIFLSGTQSSKKNEYLKNVLKEHAKEKAVPNDLCYVNNFEDDTKPILLKFNAGDGELFKKCIEDFSIELKDELIQMFSGNNYNKQLEIIEQKYEKEWLDILKKYQAKVNECNFELVQTKEGYNVPYPLDTRGKLIYSETKLSKYIQKNEDKYLNDRNNVNMIILEMLHEESLLQDKKSDEIKDFDKNKAIELIDVRISEIKDKYNDINSKIEKYLEDIKKYVVDNLNIFKQKEEIPQSSEVSISQFIQEDDDSSKMEEYLSKLSVNVIVNNKNLECAPVIFSKDLDEYSLFGGMMFDTDKRTLATKTDFSKIIAGDIVKANGGYLVIDVEELIVNDMWNNLKKIMKNQEIKFTSKHLMTVLLSDAIESEPIDMNLKIILIGSEDMHYMLYENDPDFRELFEVHAKFDSVCDRNDATELEYAKLISKYCKENELKPLTYKAVCKVIEHSSRIADSQSKLVLYYSDLYRLLIESDSIATKNKKDVISETDIIQALNNQRERVDIATERFIEDEKTNTIITTVTGEKVGEVNALAVLDYGEFSIGKVSKITANTYSNRKYGIISVDKEANMSGPYHDKCVSIIQGFLGEQFAKTGPISLAINISFEQSYGGVDGDSATLAETCAILSNMSKTPIKQNIAITGSMNQKGEAQMIGGANDKIEGFFRSCKIKDAIDGAGVIIPRANIDELMLSKEVTDAVGEGKFTIYAIDTVYDAIEILTGKTFSEIKNSFINNNVI